MSTPSNTENSFPFFLYKISWRNSTYTENILQLLNLKPWLCALLVKNYWHTSKRRIYRSYLFDCQGFSNTILEPCSFIQNFIIDRRPYFFTGKNQTMATLIYIKDHTVSKYTLVKAPNKKICRDQWDSTSTTKANNFSFELE